MLSKTSHVFHSRKVRFLREVDKGAISRKKQRKEGEKLLRAADRYSAKAAGTSGAALRGFNIASLRVLRILRAVNNIDS
jgi:hypothetical protein